MTNWVLTVFIVVAAICGPSTVKAEPVWPPLPSSDGAVEIPGQEWPQRPGPRLVRLLIHYPDGERSAVNADTGIMLTLHNWGGVDCDGTADPQQLAERLNVVAICVNYLQSGRVDSIESPEPYDCGYLQALDALRALWYVRDQLRTSGISCDDSRLYCTGGSGGGNVSLMANKLAPRTFACIIDMCGRKKLSDDVAFNLPGGSTLDARWNRAADSPNFLSPDEQEIRFVAHPAHLTEMKRLGSAARVVVYHGTKDDTCPFDEAVEMAELMAQAGLNVEPHWVSDEHVDGRIFTSSGHCLGNRTEIVIAATGHLLSPDSPQCLRRTNATDFDLREEISYQTSGGRFVISYAGGFPVGRFEKSREAPAYADHTQLNHWIDVDGIQHVVKTPGDWAIRRQHILQHFQTASGSLPTPVKRVPLQPETIEEVRLDPPLVRRPLIRRKITYRSDETDRVPAFVFLPVGDADASARKRIPAVLCLQQTTEAGKDEPAGIRGDPSMKYALELAEMGFITMAPDYPSFGEHSYDFAPTHGYDSGSMKAIWDNIRAVDYLQSLDDVDADRIGCIGHSLGGHSAIFTAIFEPRIKAVVSSCGFTGLRHDDLPSWTGPRYFPRLASMFGNDVDRVPFDFHELIAALAPRPVLVCAATGDDDFDVTGVREVIGAAKTIYALHDAPDHLQAEYPECGHSFPGTTRQTAYTFLASHLNSAGDASH